jgi:two-component system chemotaxis response regulator CheY
MKLTDTGVMMVTPAYMSPEQILGQTADARSDQFSFCVTLYEALYSVRPFGGATMAALASSVLNGQVRSPPERSSVPVIVWQTLRRGLSVNAADRCPTMKELLADLARAPKAPRRSIAGDTFASAADLASLLETLLGRAVQARPQGSAPFSSQGAVAVYAGEDGAPAALVHFDLRAAASVAAALTSLPPEVVQAACAAGQLPDNLTDNLREVANVLTGLVRGMSAARLRIHQVHPLPDAVPPVVSAALGALTASLGFEVSIAGYPGGRVTVLGPATRTAKARDEKTALGRVLIVDDSAAMRLVVGRALRRLGVAELHEASNGEEGLHRLREGTAVEAVFVDWSMPIMDGITFVRAVRANRRFAGVRLVMVTTASEPDQMAAALAAGADAYLVKPICAEALRRKLDGIGLTTTRESRAVR